MVGFPSNPLQVKLLAGDLRTTQKRRLKVDVPSRSVRWQLVFDSLGLHKRTPLRPGRGIHLTRSLQWKQKRHGINSPGPPGTESSYLRPHGRGSAPMVPILVGR